MLLDKGADKDLPYRINEFPIRNAARRYYAKVVRLLRERGVYSYTKDGSEQMVDTELVNLLEKQWMFENWGAHSDSDSDSDPN